MKTGAFKIRMTQRACFKVESRTVVTERKKQHEDLCLLLCAPDTGIAVNSISVSSSFCCTGSEDGFLRLWSLDFANVFLEAGKRDAVGARHNV